MRPPEFGLGRLHAENKKVNSNESQFTLRGLLIAAAILVVAGVALMAAVSGSDGASANSAASAESPAGQSGGAGPPPGSEAPTSPDVPGPTTGSLAATTPEAGSSTTGPPTTTTPASSAATGSQSATAGPGEYAPAGAPAALLETPHPKASTTEQEAQANATALVARVEFCAAKQDGYLPCTTQDALGATEAAVVASARPGEVSIIAVDGGYVISAVDRSQRQWRVAKRDGQAFVRTCHRANGVTPCPLPTW